MLPLISNQFRPESRVCAIAFLIHSSILPLFDSTSTRNQSLHSPRLTSRSFPFDSSFLSRNEGLDRRRGEGAVVVARAARDGRELGRTRHLLEGDAWVVGVLEPVEAPVAALAQDLGHAGAVALLTSLEAVIAE